MRECEDAMMEDTAPRRGYAPTAALFSAARPPRQPVAVTNLRNSPAHLALHQHFTLPVPRT